VHRAWPASSSSRASGSLSRAEVAQQHQPGHVETRLSIGGDLRLVPLGNYSGPTQIKPGKSTFSFLGLLRRPFGHE